jgi:hypothetical protein
MADYHAYAGVSAARTAIDSMASWLNQWSGLNLTASARIDLANERFRKQVDPLISSPMRPGLPRLNSIGVNETDRTPTTSSAPRGSSCCRSEKQEAVTHPTSSFAKWATVPATSATNMDPAVRAGGRRLGWLLGLARVKPSRRCLAASVVQREVLASHRSRRGPSKFGWREQLPAGRHRRDEGAPSPRGAPAVGPAGGSRSAASAPRGALATRALAAPNGPRGRRMLARQYPRR